MAKLVNWFDTSVVQFETYFAHSVLKSTASNGESRWAGRACKYHRFIRCATEEEEEEEEAADSGRWRAFCRQLMPLVFVRAA